MHYDNPEEVSGKISFINEYQYTQFLLTGLVDSSGFRLYYTDRPRQEDAAVLTLGHAVVGHMIVPPRVQQYVIHGFCSSNCTDEVSVKASRLQFIYLYTVSISLKMA